MRLPTQNPSHTYNTAGLYTVSLQATNAAGSDTISKTNFIAALSETILYPNSTYLGSSTTQVSGTYANLVGDGTYMVFNGPGGILVQLTNVTNSHGTQYYGVKYEAKVHLTGTAPEFWAVAGGQARARNASATTTSPAARTTSTR